MSVINRMLRDLDARGARPGLAVAPGAERAAEVQAALYPAHRLPDDHAWSAWRRTTLWTGVLALAVGTWVLGPPWIETATRSLPAPAALQQADKGAGGHGAAEATGAAQGSAAVASAGPAHADGGGAPAATVAVATPPEAAPQAAPQADPHAGLDMDMRTLPAHRPLPAAAPVQLAIATPGARSQQQQQQQQQQQPRPQAQAYVAPGMPPLPLSAAAPRAPATDRLFAAAAGNKDLFTLVSPPAAGHPPTPLPAATARPAPASAAQRAAAALEQAQALVDDGRGAEALEAARSAVRLDPSQAEARKLAVRLAIELGDQPAATALIDEGLARNPADAELGLLRARQLMAQGRQAEALAALQVLGPQNAEAAGLRAGLLANGGDYARAAAAYEQALRLRPTNATWWLGLGVALDNQGQPQQARQAYARARALGTLRPELMAWLEQKLQ